MTTPRRPPRWSRRSSPARNRPRRWSTCCSATPTPVGDFRSRIPPASTTTRPSTTTSRTVRATAPRNSATTRDCSSATATTTRRHRATLLVRSRSQLRHGDVGRRRRFHTRARGIIPRRRPRRGHACHSTTTGNAPRPWSSRRTSLRLRRRVERPTRELKAWAKTIVDGGSSTHRRAHLRTRCVPSLGRGGNDWTVAPGDYDIVIAHSCGTRRRTCTRPRHDHLNHDHVICRVTDQPVMSALTLARWNRSTGGRTPSSIRSTSARSPTRTVTVSATSRASARGWATCRRSASTHSG